MIRVELAKEPDDFDEKVRKPGNAWLKANPRNNNFPNYWTAVQEEFFTAYNGYCAYTTFRYPTSNSVVVDHFKPKGSHRELAYEWSNYRMAGYHVNSKKNASCEVLDPFQLPEDAFFLQADGSIEPNASAFATQELIDQAEKTIRILGLNSESNCNARQQYIQSFLKIVSAEGVHQDIITYATEALKSTSRFLHREALRQGMIGIDE